MWGRRGKTLRLHFVSDPKAKPKPRAARQTGEPPFTACCVVLHDVLTTNAFPPPPPCFSFLDARSTRTPFSEARRLLTREFEGLGTQMCTGIG